MTLQHLRTLDLTEPNLAHEIAARIRTLIARQDGGDVTVAARRLHRPIAEVYLPERVLRSGNDSAALELLVSVVRNYDADARWLITGRTDAVVSPEARVTIVELLAELGDRLLEAERCDRAITRPRS